MGERCVSLCEDQRMEATASQTIEETNREMIAERLRAHGLHAAAWIMRNMSQRARQEGAFGAVAQDVMRARAVDTSRRLEILLRAVELADSWSDRNVVAELLRKYDRTND